ncbi:hypothetical protein M231_03140 [Tremella mesenterica]|uniref:Uncharacterized protein n=1 Tax=Tremella mesenterica TaxID=5217 RepID=A0A4Q1BP40_TREME|nr:hypothetical protein M231_03140 [Tremella mesenterica]
MLGGFFGLLTRTSSSLQILLALPMTLDLLGTPSFLLLSLLFVTYQTLLSTLRLTPISILSSFLSVFSPLITSSLILLTLYFYLHPPSVPTSTLSIAPLHWLVNVLPLVYASVLRWLAPLFTLVEGVCALLVIQLAGRAGKGWTEEEDYEGSRWRSILGVIAAVGIYSGGIWGVIKIFPSTAEDALSVFFLGAALTAVFFLSVIGFALRRTNVLETSMVFVYVVYSAWLSGVESSAETRAFGSGWLPSSVIPSWVTTSPLTAMRYPTVSSLASRALRGASGSFFSVLTSLPFHQTLSLGFRLGVLWMAGKILPVIRDDSAWEKDDDLEDEPTMRLSTIFLSYRYTVLTAAYTQQLLLDGGQAWSRWANIVLFLSVWSLEIMLDADDEDGSRFKIE